MANTADLIEKIFSFSRCMKEKMGSVLGNAKLSMVQLQTLVFLKKHAHVHMKSIAEYLQIELPSATNLVSHLVDMQLVARAQNEKDKRVIHIALTQKGEDLLLQAKQERAETIEKILHPLSREEKKQLMIILEKMIAVVGGKK